MIQDKMTKLTITMTEQSIDHKPRSRCGEETLAAKLNRLDVPFDFMTTTEDVLWM